MKRKVVIALAVLLVIAGAVFFGYKLHLSRVTELACTVTEESIEKLGKYPNLQRLDLSGSSCYAEIAAYGETHPGVELSYTVDVGGSQVSNHAQTLALSELDYTVEALCENAPYLSGVRAVEFGEEPVSPEKVLAVKEAFPQAALSYTLDMLGGSYTSDLEQVDLSTVSPGKAEQAALLLSLLPELKQVNLVDTKGESTWELDELEILRASAPEGTVFDCCFPLFGQMVSSSDEEIAYARIDIGNEGLDTIRKALPYLRSCKRFLLDDCGIDYELLAQLRDDFPETKIVWRVVFGIDSLLTDATVLWSIYVRDENCDVLKYCTDILYIDLGHTLELTDISFMQYMTKLQVVIIARTGVSDITPLLNCPDLEYLEIFSTEVTDLAPLAEMHNLEHLNISNLPEVTDISPLYGLTKLKRLRLVMDNVPEEQKEEIAERLPNCEMMFYAVNPTDNGWRRDRLNNYVERYALLREQIGYDGYNSPADKINLADIEKYGYTLPKD